MSNCRITSYVKPIFQTPKDACYWFGYYNYDPINLDGKKLLCNRAEFDATPIVRGMTIDVGFFDLTTKEWQPIGKTDSFNWQQGAMLQWIPTNGIEDRLIYNCSHDGHIISKIHDINTGKIKELDYPIYGITPDGKKSISLNMERAYWCRGYHYQSVSNPKYDVDVAEDDGIYEIDLEANSCRRIISIEEVINLDYDPSFEKAKHWLEHVMISPDGARFCFLHRFSLSDIFQYETRLFVANIDGSDLQVVDGWRQYRWSHFGWGHNGSFVIYAYKKNTTFPIKTSSGSNIKRHGMKEFVKSAYHHFAPLTMQMYLQQKKAVGTRFYQYYELENKTFVKKEEWGGIDFCIDGHPSFTSDDQFMLTDSYPDWRGLQKLIVFDKKNKNSLTIGRFKDALTRKPGSCDLHPKLSRSCNKVTIDTAYDGKHHVIVFNLEWEKIKSAISNVK